MRVARVWGRLISTALRPNSRGWRSAFTPKSDLLKVKGDLLKGTSCATLRPGQCIMQRASAVCMKGKG